MARHFIQRIRRRSVLDECHRKNAPLLSGLGRGHAAILACPFREVQHDAALQRIERNAGDPWRQGTSHFQQGSNRDVEVFTVPHDSTELLGMFFI